MAKKISYRQALEGVVNSDDAEALVGLVEGVKNWGDHIAKIPAHIVVLLIDEIKALKEQQLNYYSKDKP